MRFKRAIKWTMAVCVILFLLAFGFYRFGFDWSARPFCHKQMMTSFMLWMDDQGMDIDSHTNAFPNINGSSQESLATIREQMGHMDWATNYNYVPGLREDDPGDLVLMYVNRPTRWTWHAPAPTRFAKKAWIVVPVDFKMGMGMNRPAGPGELSERISQAEFEERLNKTLDFLRTNERPNWKAVVAEHTKFLNSVHPPAP